MSRAAGILMPIQDWLGMGNRCRINTPSTLGINWRGVSPASS